MGLITKTVKVKWNSKIKKHYVDLGYKYTKMGDEFEVKIEDLTKGSKIRVKCICDGCGKELEREYYEYIKCIKNDKKTYCSKCGNAQRFGLDKFKTFEEFCIENNRQDILDRWDYDKNNKKPSEIPYGTNEKYWFKCYKHPEHHSELKNIHNITCNKEGFIECNQCNSFAQWMIDNNLKIEDYWDYDKNTISPWDISCGSNKKIWIKCQEKDYHGSYEVICKIFKSGHKCPYCTGRKIHPKDSLGQYIIDNFGESFLDKIWSNENEKSPFEYMPNSNQKVWWKCVDDNHEDYLRICASSVQYNFRCPQCSNERKESLGEEQVRLYLEELGYNSLHEHNCTITPINPKTQYSLPYDNEIILDNGEHLIIEVNGEQHYNCRFYKVINKCSQEEAEQQLHYQQVKDRYKRIYAIQNGYYYLEIPYKKIFDKQETYKKLIDDKINEIKQIKNNQQEESA